MTTCDCDETSCKDGCTKTHTCKTYSCEDCEIDALSITETISQLDDIYTKPYWTAQERSIFVDNFPALRRAAIAGEALATAVEDIAPTTDARGSLDFEVFRYRSAIEEKNV